MNQDGDADALAAYLADGAGDEAHPAPLFLRGDAAQVLTFFPEASVDCVVTSPPYFGHRRYAGGGIGAEGDWQDYVAALGAVTAELLRVLKPTGSLWLNLGDTYRGKRQLGVPWRVAFHLADEQGWTLRNSVVWHKVKGGPDTSRDKLRNVHELLFHFVRRPKGYYYDDDAVRRAPRARARGERRRGQRDRRERRALPPPDRALHVARRRGEGGGHRRARRDARRGGGRPPRRLPHGHPRPPARDALRRRRRVRPRPRARRSAASTSSGTTRTGPSWATSGTSCRRTRRAGACTSRPFPADLCRTPILATCPPGGVVLDPFCGTGTAMLVASELGRRSVGIDLAAEYLDIAAERLGQDSSAGLPPVVEPNSSRGYEAEGGGARPDGVQPFSARPGPRAGLPRAARCRPWAG